MFKVMKQKDLIREIERKGFVLARNGEHKVFVKDNLSIIIPHSNTISSGIVHQTYKVLRKVA